MVFFINFYKLSYAKLTFLRKIIISEIVIMVNALELCCNMKILLKKSISIVKNLESAPFFIIFARIFL